MLRHLQISILQGNVLIRLDSSMAKALEWVERRKIISRLHRRPANLTRNSWDRPHSQEAAEPLADENT